MSDALVEAEGLLRELPDAVVRQKLGERLRQAMVSLSTADHQISRIVAVLELSQIVDFGRTEEQCEQLLEMKECAVEIGTLLEKAEDAEELHRAVYEYDNTLKKSLSALERAVREKLRAVAAARFQPLVAFGELLTLMNVPNNLGARLVDCGKRGLRAVSIVPLSELLATVRALLAELDTLQEERAAEIGDSDVGGFINALAENRATLAMVTPKVHEWLQKHSALERLVISLH